MLIFLFKSNSNVIFKLILYNKINHNYDLVYYIKAIITTNVFWSTTPTFSEAAGYGHGVVFTFKNPVKKYWQSKYIAPFTIAYKRSKESLYPVGSIFQVSSWNKTTTGSSTTYYINLCDGICSL